MLQPKQNKMWHSKEVKKVGIILYSGVDSLEKSTSNREVPPMQQVLNIPQPEVLRGASV